MGSHAMASGNEDAPGQLKKAEETESDDILQESEEESTDDSDDSAGAETAEEAEEEEVSDEEETQQFRSSDGGGSSDASASKSSGSSSGGSDDKSSSTSSSDFVESAEDCPNEKNRYGEFTGNGANTSGDYDSTCDGRASLNGNGSGNAGGRPCQGCVGNADNKNPKGQFPNGSDHNNGYECDGNNGIAKGNPAHTDCPETRSRPPKPPTCPDGRPMPPNGVCDVPVKRPPLPDVIKRPSVPPDRVLPRQPFGRPPEVPKWKPRQRIQGVLPVTGPSQLLPFIWVAMSLIAAGIAALLTDRRRRELGARDW